jgi:hypothetical protein
LEIPDIVVPEIKVFTYIPATNKSLNIPLPNVGMPGCVKTHRDISIKNTQIVQDDPNGAFYSCPDGSSLPSYIPINYNPRKLEIVEESKPSAIDTPDPPKTDTPEIPKNETKEEIVIPPCPDPKSALRVGSYANDKKLERVKAFELVNNECNIIWEDVPFSESYIPSIPTIISTSAIALVAATSPLILNIIKPLIKNLIKKVTAKKKS